MVSPRGTGANALPIQSTRRRRRTIITGPATTANSAATNGSLESFLDLLGVSAAERDDVLTLNLDQFVNHASVSSRLGWS